MSPSPPLPVTEDTPPDMLSGSMDLGVILPSGQCVKMSILRSTPMMDLLIQITTAHGLSPGSHSIQALGDKGVLPYKPSTPIGALETFSIRISQKRASSVKKPPQAPPQSFLNTFRLQVHLPRSQLFVARVTPNVTLSGVLTLVCTEKDLDMSKYELRKTVDSEDSLDINKTLGDYQLQELSLVAKDKRPMSVIMNSEDILKVKSSNHRQNSVCDSSLSSGSMESRSISPAPPVVNPVPPQPPMRKKRRPAPKPPTDSKQQTEICRPVIAHSRESSDSSGYHEASLLSESPTHGMSVSQSLPRRGKLLPSQSMSSLDMIPRGRLTSSASISSLNSNGTSRKKKAAPPPPTGGPAIDTKVKSSTLPTKIYTDPRNDITDSPDEPRVDETPELPYPRSADNPSRLDGDLDPLQGAGSGSLITTSVDEGHDSIDWQYQLPPPPTDFRDREVPTAHEPISKESPMSTNDAPLHGLQKKNVKSTTNDVRLVQDKTNVMNELTNVLNRNIRIKEKSLSVSNLYLKEEVANGSVRNNQRLFSTQPSSLQNFRLTTYELENNQRKLSHSSELVYADDINYRNSKNLEKSSSLESISLKAIAADPVIEKDQDVFRKPIAPVEKKMKSVKRSTSMLVLKNSVDSKKPTVENRQNQDEMHMLEKQFLEFLEERKILNSDIKVKSLEVIRSIFPQLNDGTSMDTSLNEGGLNTPSATSDRQMLNENLTLMASETLQHREAIKENTKHIQESEKVDRNDHSVENTNPQDVEKVEIRKAIESNKVDTENVRKDSFTSINREDSDEVELESERKGRDVISVHPKLSKKGESEKEAREGHTHVNSKDSWNIEIKKEIREAPQESKKIEIVNETRESHRGTLANPKGSANIEIEKEVKEGGKRNSYQGPPAFNFSTWGERPRTSRVVIRDEDYTTRENVDEKKGETAKYAVRNKLPQQGTGKPAVQLKRPGGLSHYEIFSALPRKKDPTPLDLIQQEDKEVQKMNSMATPIVCGVELKKEFLIDKKPIKEDVMVVQSRPLKHSQSSVSIKTQFARPLLHSSSVYLNGAESKTSFLQPRRNPINAMMPVVKGFRAINETAIPPEKGKKTGEIEDIQSENVTSVPSNSSDNAKIMSPSMVGAYVKKNPQPLGKSDICSTDILQNASNENQTAPTNAPRFGGIPPPPPVGLALLKPVASRPVIPKINAKYPRDQLLEQIRNFGGFDNLKKTAQ